MSIDFSQSKTRVNLMKSFVGESIATQQYNISASFASKENLYIIKRAFLTIADQEREHGKIFYNFLKAFSGQKINFDADYPVNLFNSTLGFLKKAYEMEAAESDQNGTYNSFSRIAKDEGFLDISKKFAEVALIEKTHSEKFNTLSSCLENGTLFKTDTPTTWICLECGRVHYGTSAPNVCPVCGHDIGYYIRNDLISCIS